MCTIPLVKYFITLFFYYFTFLYIGGVLRKFLALLVSIFIIDRNTRKYVRDLVQYFNIVDYFKFKKNKYRILSLGSFCFPRVVTTYAKIKPRKIYGEKSSVFDLAFHSNLDQVIKLINTNFKNFFDDVEFDQEQNCWINNTLGAIYNHDARLSKDDFIRLYKKRIENFYDYINDEKFLFVIYSISYATETKRDSIEKLYNIVQKLRGDKKFAFIILNHNKNLKNEVFEMKNTFFIDLSYFNTDGWADKIRKTKDGRDFAKNVGNEIRNYIKSFDLF